MHVTNERTKEPTNKQTRVLTISPWELFFLNKQAAGMSYVFGTDYTGDDNDDDCECVMRKKRKSQAER